MKREFLLFLLLFVSPVLAADSPTKKADDKLKKLVNEAIDRGAKWLKTQQKPDGRYNSLYGRAYSQGPTALATLALLHAGEDPKGDTVSRAFASMRKADRDMGESVRQTYSVSVVIMALTEYGRALGKGRFSLSEEDLRWLKDLTLWLVRKRTARGVWHYPSGGNYDHSNTQYALLALKEARRVGVRVAPSVFVGALEHFLRVQEKNGPKVPRYEEKGGDGVYTRNLTRTRGSDRARGWGYTAKMPVTGSMTAAGVAAVAICRGELAGDKWKHLREKAVQSERDGLAWLGKHFSVKYNPGMAQAWHYYYLYGLERAGVLAGVVYMGSHRWYAEGAKFLVNSQAPDGAWRTAQAAVPRQLEVDVVDSCFALLFLVRATARSFGVVTERSTLNLTEADKLSDADLANVFKAAFAELATLEGEAQTDRASDFAFCGPRVIPLLIRKLASEDEATRARAFLVLKAITSKTFDYDPKGPPGGRAAAVDRFTAWWLTNRKKLALDRPAKQIR